jgi:hypothetical protein
MKSTLVCLFACIGAAAAVPAFSNIGGHTVERVKIQVSACAQPGPAPSDGRCSELSKLCSA